MPRPGLNLTRAQEEDLRDELQISRGQKDLDRCLRIQGLLLVHQGYREADAAATIGVGRRTLQEWIRRYRDRGIAGLSKGPYPGGTSRLTQQQQAELSKIIEAGPRNAGLDTGVWSAPILVKLVEHLYGVSYSSSHMGRILHSLRLSVQYPIRKYPKAGENAREQRRKKRHRA
jgi:transposase